MSQNVLIVSASARGDASSSLALSRRLAEKLGGDVVERDTAAGIPLVDSAWIGANFTDAAERTDEQNAELALSEELIGEIEAADTIVIALPIYNFGMPAALKAWFDQVARARRTFAYSESGPKGLLTGKKAYIVVSSGGTEVFSPIDWATPHVKHLLGFIGIDDVTVIAADKQMFNGDAIHRAEAEIDRIAEEARAA
ncbi:MAG: FMN-dependent NADH-azoreductase [Rubricella sp.]